MRTMIEAPIELLAACKNEAIDGDWPIQSPGHSLELLTEWEEGAGRPVDVNTHTYRLTHSHAHEWEDLAKMGVDRVYRESIYTKYVSIAWHLAGRYYYDAELIKWLSERNWPHMSLIDFGAAPWIQSVFYAKKGMLVTAINQDKDSDCHRFGKWLARKSGLEDGDILDYSADDIGWSEASYDIVYAVDVLEHIPPTKDGLPGWFHYAERLLSALKPGGLWYVNAPLEICEGVPRPVETHPNHYTSPISIQDWEKDHGLEAFGTFIRRKAK